MPVHYWQYVCTMKGESTYYLQENLKNNSAQCNIQSSEMNYEEIPILSSISGAQKPVLSILIP